VRYWLRPHLVRPVKKGRATQSVKEAHAESRAVSAMPRSTDTRERRGGFACCRGEEDLDRDGLLVVCSTTDQQCLNSATKITTPRTQRTTLTLWHSFSGYTVGYSSFTVTIVPPTSEQRASRAQVRE